MSYTLEGRAIPDVPPPPEDGDDDYEVGPAPCIFCGEEALHVNDGGESWITGAIVDGKTQYFLYHLDCNPGPSVIWRCGCEASYVENVGDRCHACKLTRAEAAEYPSIRDCPSCGGHLMAREPGGPDILMRCDKCLWRGRCDYPRLPPLDPSEALRIKVLEVADTVIPSLRVWFNNGVTKTVDVSPLLKRELFSVLNDPELFAQVRLLPGGGVSWPGRLYMPPESLLSLPPLS